MNARPTTRRRTLAAGLLVLAGAAGAAGLAIGSDHQDTPDVELNPKMDMTDVYAFPGSAAGRIALVMNSRAFLTPGATAADASFDPDLLYQFKIDNDGDAREDRVVQISFTGSGADQQVAVRGPVAPPVQGAMMNEIADVSADVSGAINTPLGTSTGLQVFAGPRDDPFFLDLEAFFCIVPDRKPVGGPLAAPCALPANPAAPFFFRNPGVNYIAGFNVLSIVVELPSALLENGAPGKLGIWGTISR
ncbi:MAG TPA: DUF4331 family protein [Gemmatimonadales bacterium]|jgi:hypothetical protein|nr:DUF4331 family protein [Gemmatimonadales bacterium]